MSGINLEKHFSLSSSSLVKEICDPLLQSIGITYFNYIKIYNSDCSRELLTNNANWINHFYKNSLYNSVGAIDIEHLLPKGYFLWSEMDQKDPIYLQGRDFFNIDNGISFVIKRSDVTYLYIFASSRDQHCINNFYLSSKKAECAALLAKGRTSKQIAKIMDISHRTVEGYLLDIKNQLQITLNKTLSKEQLIKILQQSNIQ